MNQPISLSQFDTRRRKEAARKMRLQMFASCREILAELSGEITGYAIVAWSPDGDLRSIYEIHGGPIGAALMPTLVADALNRHIAAEMAKPVPVKDDSDG
jgi:hypothetical protein